MCGWPVEHSLSPIIHSAALRAVGLDDWTYVKLPIAPERFSETIRSLPGQGFVGVNVTVPHKRAALSIATDPTARASAVGSANTLTFRDDQTIEADNSDVYGLLKALPPERSLSGASVLVLGAGGVSRAAVYAANFAGAREVMIWGRRPEQAQAIANELGARSVDQPQAHAADFIFNCTTVGMERDDDVFAALPLTPEMLTAKTCVIDLPYTIGETQLVRYARQRGLTVVSGLDVLIYQAAGSFETWTGLSAPVAVMRNALKDAAVV